MSLWIFAKLLAHQHTVTQKWQYEVLFTVHIMSPGIAGGSLFEQFAMMIANYECRRFWKSVRKKCKRQRRSVSDAENSKMMKMAKVSLYFHVLGVLGSGGTSAKRQLFFLTLLYRHKGLSRSGIELLNKINIALPPRSFDAQVEDHLYRYDERLRFVHKL